MAVSSTVFGVVIIVTLIIAGVGGYYLGTSITVASVSTITISSGGLGNAAQQFSVLAQDAAAAQAECGSQPACLTVYSTIDASDWETYMAPNFYQQFPWAAGKVNWFSTSAAQITSMAITEYRTDNVKGDLVVATEGIIYPIILAGAIQNYTSPMAPLVNETASSGGADPNGAWYICWVTVPVIQYDPQQLQALNLPPPMTWSDLGNPVYKSHIGFQSAAAFGTTTGIFYSLYNQMGNASWTALMYSIAANEPVITRSASATTDNVVTGKVAVGIGLYNDYLAAHSTSPDTIAFVAPPPHVYNPGVSAVRKGASHPAMAKLMSDWLMSNMGATALAETDRASLNRQVTQIFNLLPPGTSSFVSSYTNPTIFNNLGAWSDLFKNIYGA